MDKKIFGIIDMLTFKPRVKKAAGGIASGKQRQKFKCSAGTRGYVLHLPQGRRSAPSGLIVMLHGCGQTPEDFAAGTGMNALADSYGFAVLYPAQTRRANVQGCWRWFDGAHQQRNGAEPRILAALTRKIMQDHAIPEGQVFVAGLSAGAAMAVVMGQTYGDLFRAVGAHSGLPYRAAHDAASAFAAMGGAAQLHGRESPQRTIIFHGTADKTVHFGNSTAIAQAQGGALGTATRQISEVVDHAGHTAKRDVTLDAQNVPVLEHWTVAGLGHAWSGGSQTGSYTDPNGPGASAAMVRFFFDTPAG